MRLPVKFTFTPCWSTWVPPRQGPEPQRRAGLLTCAAVVKLQRALDAEGLLAGATPVPVLAVDLVGGRGSGQQWGSGDTLSREPLQQCRASHSPSLCYPPVQLRHTNRAWLTHCPGKRSIQVTLVPTLASGSSPIPGSISPGPGLPRPLWVPLPTPSPGTLRPSLLCFPPSPTSFLLCL